MRFAVVKLALISTFCVFDSAQAEGCINTLSNETPYPEVLRCFQEEINSLRGKESLPVGTVIASVVAPGVMTETGVWQLANGDEISSDLPYSQRMGTNVLPDFRGVFLRGMNVGRSDEFADPDGDRSIATFQSDLFSAHEHSSYMVLNGWPDDSGGRTRDLSPNYLVHSTMRGNRGNVPTSSQGGVENRPVNASIYYYIKVK